MLKAVIGISEGRPRGEILDDLYSQIGALEKVLVDDEDARKWFSLTTSISSTPPPSEARSTPLAGAKLFILFNPPSKDNTAIPKIFQDNFKGQSYLFQPGEMLTEHHYRRSSVTARVATCSFSTILIIIFFPPGTIVLSSSCHAKPSR